ncbi:MAG: ribonuclease III [Clostridia bacterium]|nr:ribonuclease III [Clostridia bacterium]
MVNNFEIFEKNIGYIFKNKDLLKKALTHTSYAYENKIESYERLEYLGDSILEFISSKYLFENFKSLSEGEMTKVRAYAVCEDSLYKIALKHNFSDFLYLGKSEKATHTNKKAILADSVEAVIAAMYLDSQDINTVQNFVLENIKEQVEFASKNVGVKDYKTVLQEMLQIHGEVLIKYNIINESGPDHDKTFTAEVECDGKKLATGIGRSKKAAEMEAARKAIERLN